MRPLYLRQSRCQDDYLTLSRTRWLEYLYTRKSPSLHNFTFCSNTIPKRHRTVEIRHSDRL